MISLTQDKKETIKQLQEAVGRSAIRLQILKNITKKESVDEIVRRLNIPQPTVSKAISRFETYKLIEFVKKKGKSEIYDKKPMLKQIGSLDRWIKVEIDESPNDENGRTKAKQRIQVPSSIPFIDPQTERDADKMARPYIVLYLFENSLRNFIIKILDAKHGENWWNTIGIKNEILDKVKSRKNLENEHKWHVRRGAHEIFYTDLEDLTYFLRKDDEFKNYMSIEHWSTTIGIALKLSRNIVDHHNPLPSREIRRLEQTLEDWKRQVGN